MQGAHCVRSPVRNAPWSLQSLCYDCSMLWVLRIVIVILIIWGLFLIHPIIGLLAILIPIAVIWGGLSDRN